MKYFLDTNIVSYILNGNAAVKNTVRELLLRGNDVLIPDFVYYEIKRGLLAANAAKKLSAFDDFVKAFGIAAVTLQAFDLASHIYAQLKQSGKLIEDADLLIGCSALCRNAILITNNEKHFKKIENLQILAVK